MLTLTIFLFLLQLLKMLHKKYICVPVFIAEHLSNESFFYKTTNFIILVFLLKFLNYGISMSKYIEKH